MEQLEQYDDHCYLCVLGETWRIERAKRNIISIMRPLGRKTAMMAEVDISKLDIEEYCKVAAYMLYRRYRE